MVLTLIGYRGSGKSTVGQQLAARLNWDFVDSDLEIERQAGKSIAQIFADEGEPHFRHLEASVIGETLRRDSLVLAVGGGAILNLQSRQALKVAGPVIWLQADLNELLDRMQRDESTAQRRPALTSADRRTEVEVVLAERWPLYQETASQIIQTDGRTVTAIVDHIVASLSAETAGQW